MKKSLLPLAGLAALCLTSCGQTTFDNSKLVIGLECAYAPFNWAENAENEHTLKVQNKAGVYADGYDIQMAKILGNKLGIDVEIHQIAWEDLILGLQTGAINAVVAGMTDTEERRMTIDFTNEYYRSELVLVVPSDVASTYDHALSAEEFGELINNKIVVSQSSTVTNDVIDTFVANYNAIHANPVDTFALAAQDVSNESAFAMTAELPVARSIISSFSNLGILHIDQSILGEAQAKLGVSIGVAKGNNELRNSLNAALSEITTEQRNDMMEQAVIRSANK